MKGKLEYLDNGNRWGYYRLMSELHNAYYRKNSEKIKEQQREYYWKNIDKQRMRGREKYKRKIKERGGGLEKFSVNSVGRIGEKEFLNSFPNAVWLGGHYDGVCDLGKVDIKTARPTNHRNGKKKWKFHLSLQRGVVDNFILFFLKEDNSIEKVMVIPDSCLKVNDISIVVGSQSKYDKYIINL